MRKIIRKFNIDEVSLTIIKTIGGLIIGILVICRILFAPVPVLLSYDADYWIDQYGKTMKSKDAERFLAWNPEYTWEIIQLNKNPYYATNLQNEHRSKVLKDVYERTYLSRCRFIDNLYDNYPIDDTSILEFDLGRITYVTAAHRIILTPPSEDAFKKVLYHVGACSERYDIEDLMEYCKKRCYTGPDYEKDTCEKQYYDKIVDYVFFGTIAKYYADTNVICDCMTPISEIPQIPVILSSDNKTWLDQNGRAMNETEATAFLLQHDHYTQVILGLNSNPYYLDTRYNAKRKEAIEKMRSSLKCKEVAIAQHKWPIQEMMKKTPSYEILCSYQHKLGLNGETGNITTVINGIENGDSLQRLYFSYYNYANCIFWCAVANVTESGTFETSFEPENTTAAVKETEEVEKTETSNAEKEPGIRRIPKPASILERENRH